MSNWTAAIRRHYEEFWKSASSRCEFSDGPIWQLPPDFEVVHLLRSDTVALHVYATVGMSRPSDVDRLELFVLSRQQNIKLVELLYMAAHFHRTGNSLGLDHSINIGRPWLEGSQCDHALISLPYGHFEEPPDFGMIAR
ncbi:hypothetical protein [Novosphingobium sp. 9]|uniref:hypothetical protein n=1 Tax=Novosphingobium sp. 9 TaxID=2025349 RepID=UPI0021B67A44|nr:hypothetical protein [Novosphingobium sp. 9]